MHLGPNFSARGTLFKYGELFGMGKAMVEAPQPTFTRQCRRRWRRRTKLARSTSRWSLEQMGHNQKKRRRRKRKRRRRKLRANCDRCTLTNVMKSVMLEKMCQQQNRSRTFSFEKLHVCGQVQQVHNFNFGAYKNTVCFIKGKDSSKQLQ